MSDFAQAKINARRAVQAAFGVRAYYFEDDTASAYTETRARWHNKISRPVGDLESGGYTEIIEGIDRIVLIPEDVDGFPLTLARGGIFELPDILPGVRFELNHREPHDGPLEEAWAVTRRK